MANGRAPTALAAALVAFACAASAAGVSATGLQDVEHLVIFMQENRPTDHYYGSLAGMRGFNDRAAPKLPNGNNVFYQPASAPNNETALCGCAACDLKWTILGDVVKSTLLGLPCETLVQGLTDYADPPVPIQNGELCSALMTNLLNATLFKMPVTMFMENSSTCAPTLKVDGLPSAEQEAMPDYILPFNLQFNRTSASCMPAPEMDYACDIAMWNGGLVDRWNVARSPGMGMSYFNRTDLPYYYALADAFTIGDQYFQSTFTATNPNRLHLFSGSNGLSVPDSGYCMLDDSEPSEGFPWETMAETLEKADVSWQVIQESDNFDDNAFEWFTTFKNAKSGSSWYDKGIQPVPDLVEEFGRQVANDSLPSVTWIVGPAHLSEHATNHPADGEDLSARIIAELAKEGNADVYKKTIFVLNYDEGGQFFDHHWTPTPPRNAEDGIATMSVEGELTLKSEFGIPAGHPIGMGFRVPLFIISPWTRGGYVYSEVTDHTSVIKLIEERFGVSCPNISPWRRAISGNLLAAFNWDAPDFSWPKFPDTSRNVNNSAFQCDHLPAPSLPATQSFPVQEAGVRKAMPLPYDFNVTTALGANGNVNLTVSNIGTQGAAFQLYNLLLPANPPRKYSIESGKSITDTFTTSFSNGAYSLSLHGPNGFVRVHNGTTAHSYVSVVVSHDKQSSNIVFWASVAAECDIILVDNAYGTKDAVTMATSLGAATHAWSVEQSANWYDVTVSLVPSSSCKLPTSFGQRYMGHLENGKITTTDPAMAQGASAATFGDMPGFPSHLQASLKWDPAKECATARQRMKDQCWGYGTEKEMEERRREL